MRSPALKTCSTLIPRVKMSVSVSARAFSTPSNGGSVSSERSEFFSFSSFAFLRSRVVLRSAARSSKSTSKLCRAPSIASISCCISVAPSAERKKRPHSSHT